MVNQAKKEVPLLSTVREHPPKTLGDVHEIEGGDKKKGISKFYLNEAEEDKFLSYVPRKPEYLDWETIKLSSHFALK